MLEVQEFYAVLVTFFSSLTTLEIVNLVAVVSWFTWLFFWALSKLFSKPARPIEVKVERDNESINLLVRALSSVTERAFESMTQALDSVENIVDSFNNTEDAEE